MYSINQRDLYKGPYIYTVWTKKMRIVRYLLLISLYLGIEQAGRDLSILMLYCRISPAKIDQSQCVYDLRDNKYLLLNWPILIITSANFSAPFLWSASEASASLPLKIGFSNFLLNSDTVPESIIFQI